MPTTDSQVKNILLDFRYLEQQFTDLNVLNNPTVLQELITQFNQLKPIAIVAQQLQQAQKDYITALEFTREDSSFLRECNTLSAHVSQLQVELDLLLYGDHTTSSYSSSCGKIIMELKAGEGGEDACLFTAELTKMYTQYAATRGAIVKPLNITYSSAHGYKEATLFIYNICAELWSCLSHENGVHRVQRVPATETQGRMHTSFAGVLVYPELTNVTQASINEKDIRVDTYRSSGKGGQNVNKTDSAVRITHVPSGIVVTCQNERSQTQHKAHAMQVLASRLQHQLEQEKATETAVLHSSLKQIRRGNHIRTYNYPENRVTDHRSGVKIYALNKILAGELDLITAS